MDAHMGSIRYDPDNEWLDRCKGIKNVKLANNLYWKGAFPFYLGCIWIPRNANHFNATKLDIPASTPYERAMKFLHLTGCTTTPVQADRGAWSPPKQCLGLN